MKQFQDAKVFNTDFHLSLFQKLGSLTHETRIKDAVNMGDLICLLATVRTLKEFQKETVALNIFILFGTIFFFLINSHFNAFGKFGDIFIDTTILDEIVAKK